MIQICKIHYSLFNINEYFKPKQLKIKDGEKWYHCYKSDATGLLPNPYFVSLHQSGQKSGQSGIGWYWYDETGDIYGPFKTEYEAQFELDRYCKYLNS